jgi:hypothetical protein
MPFPREVLDRLVFSVGEQDYRWADVVDAGRAWSRWGELERETARALSALEELTEPISNVELDEAEQSFRYARNLLAADETQAWLDHWGLSARDWSDYLRRELARSRGDTKGDSSPGEDKVWAQAVCSGVLAELARDLAARAAAAEATGADPGPVDTDLARMGEALAAFQRDALTPQTQAKTLELRSADWVRISYTALELPESGMASEAALCVRDDGLSLAEVAERARVPVVERESFIEEVEADLSKSLLSAPPGELVGPLRIQNGFALFRVNEKVAPALGDPLIRDRLEEEVPRRALEREVRNRVRWHERL